MIPEVGAIRFFILKAECDAFASRGDLSVQNPDVVVHAKGRYIVRQSIERPLDEIVLQRNVAIVEEKHKWAVGMQRPRFRVQLAIVLVTRSRRNTSHVQRQIAIQIKVVLVDIEKPKTGLG